MPARSVFRRALLACAVGTTLLPAAPPPARAVAFVCVNCADNITQLFQYAREAETALSEAQIQASSATMLVNQVRDMANFPSFVTANIAGDISAVQSLMQRGTQLATNAGMVSSQLSNYSSYLGTPPNYAQKYSAWSQQANDNVTATLSGFGLMRAQTAGDRAVVDAIRARSAGADGAVRAIQANTEMAGAQVNELHRLREIMLEDARMNANALQIAADRQAVGDADMTRFMAAPAPAFTGNPRY